MDNHALLAFVGPEACRFALMEAAEPRPRLSQYREIPVRRDQSLLTVMAEYATGLGRPLPPRLGLAVAAPVNDERITVTQSGWSFTRAELCETFGFETLSIINDAAAAALSLQWLEAGDTLAIGAADAPVGGLAEGRYAVVSADFGLGVSAVEIGPDGCRVIDTEAGHLAFAPDNAEEAELLTRLSAVFGRVSYERLISWPGLANVHEALARAPGATPPAMRAASASAGSATSTATWPCSPACSTVAGARCAISKAWAAASNRLLRRRLASRYRRCGNAGWYCARWRRPRRSSDICARRES